MFDFGFLFRNWEVVTNAAREGARVGVLPAYSCADGSADVEGRVDNYMAGAGIVDGFDVDLRIDSIGAGGHTFSACIVNVTLDQALAVAQRSRQRSSAGRSATSRWPDPR